MTHDHAKELLRGLAPDRTGAETDRAAARLAEDLDAAPPPAKAADPDGFDYYAYAHGGGAFRFRPGSREGEMALSPTSEFHFGASLDDRHADGFKIGPVSRAAIERFLGWTKANPDDHGDNGQPRRSLKATLARMPRCAACDQPLPTHAPSRFTAENDAHLRRVLREQTRRVTEAADTLRIEGPFPDCAERDLLVAAAKSVLRYAGGQ